MKYNQNGTNPQGNLQRISEGADGGMYRLKSTNIESRSQDTNRPLGWASFRGKATYEELGWSEPKVNYTYTVYAEDCNEPGNGADRFWIEVKDPQGGVVDVLSISRTPPANAVNLNGGSIRVPHGGK